MRTKSKIPDYNPDKERWHKHRWIVTKANTSPDFNAVEVGEKMMPFDGQGRFSVSDEGVADAIRQKYRWDAAVTRFKMDDPADRGHKYLFGQLPEMPWKKGKSDGETEGEEKEKSIHPGEDGRDGRDGGRDDPLHAAQDAR